jgi:hypothetical protein
MLQHATAFVYHAFLVDDSSLVTLGVQVDLEDRELHLGISLPGFAETLPPMKLHLPVTKAEWDLDDLDGMMEHFLSRDFGSVIMVPRGTANPYEWLARHKEAPDRLRKWAVKQVLGVGYTR